MREKTSISAAPVFPPVDWTTSNRRRRPANDTRATRGSRRLPAGKGRLFAAVNYHGEGPSGGRAVRHRPRDEGNAADLAGSPQVDRDEGSVTVAGRGPLSRQVAVYSVRGLVGAAPLRTHGNHFAPMAISCPWAATCRGVVKVASAWVWNTSLGVGGGKAEAVGGARGQAVEYDEVRGVPVPPILGSSTIDPSDAVLP